MVALSSISARQHHWQWGHSWWDLNVWTIAALRAFTGFMAETRTAGKVGASHRSVELTGNAHYDPYREYWLLHLREPKHLPTHLPRIRLRQTFVPTGPYTPVPLPIACLIGMGTPAAHEGLR